MATPIRIPDLGTTGDRVKLVGWLKEEGEFVARGEPLCEVESDKAVMELESVAEGVLLRQVAPLDVEIEQGTVIAYVGRAGEEIPEAEETQAAPPEPAREAPGAATPQPLRVSPIVRNLAKRLGVNLDRVQGSGPGGTITREDVQRAAQPAQAPGTVPLSANQRAVARRVSQSLREIPTIHLVARIDMSSALRLRQREQEASAQKASFDALFVFGVSRVVADFPHFLGSLHGEEMAASSGVHIGCAVSSEDDLFIPVVHDADRKTLAQIDAEIRALAEKAQSGRLSPAQMVGASLTVSNLGMYPVQAFSAIIPPGQSAALAVGAIEEVPAIEHAKVASKPMVSVTLSVDHRLINGREAARFLGRLKEFVEDLGAAL
jgi:pyruvate dehydrogenase E2 component (dihydrolipoamide acetyltransferase)